MKPFLVFALPLYLMAHVVPSETSPGDVKPVVRGSSVQVFSSTLDTSKSIQVTLTPDLHAGDCASNTPLPVITTVASTTTAFTFSVPFDASFCVYTINAVQVPGEGKSLALTPAHIRIAGEPPLITAVSPNVLLADSLAGDEARNCSAAFTFLGPASLKGNADYQVHFVDRAVSKCGADPHATDCYKIVGSTDGQVKVCYKGSRFLREFAGKQSVSLSLNGAESAAHDITFINASSATPRNWSLGLTAILLGFLYILVRLGCGVTKKIFGKQYLLMALFLDEQTMTYSLSKCQFYAWTVASVLGYIYFAISRSIIQNSAAFPEIPGGLPAILLFSAGTAVLTTGIVSAKGNKGAGEIHPSLGDFITTGGVVAPERVQFVVWTIVGICTFLTIVYKSDPVSIADLPRIPSGFLQLMGLSSAGFLAGKLARKAGPTITAIDVTQAQPNLQLLIRGTGLSQNATFSIEGEEIAPVQILNAEGKPSLPEVVQKDETNNEPGFGKILRLTVTGPSAAWMGSKNITLTNPDAQKAVWRYDTTKVTPSAAK